MTGDEGFRPSTVVCQFTPIALEPGTTLVLCVRPSRHSRTRDAPGIRSASGRADRPNAELCPPKPESLGLGSNRSAVARCVRPGVALEPPLFRGRSLAPP